MSEIKDIITIRTNIGYAKILCASETTVKDMINMALRTVSLATSSYLYGLYLNPETKSPNSLKRLLCRSLTWEELKMLYNPDELTLAICLYPTKFEEAARSDRSTLFYLHQQAKELYHSTFKEIRDSEMAFEIGCLDIRSVVPSSAIQPKELMDLVEKVRPIHTFFPPCVTQQNKIKTLKRLVQNYLSKIRHYSEEDCVLDMLNRYLVLLQFDRDVVRCSFGAGYGIPAELVIGPRYQVSIKIENARQARLLAYFASIRQVLVSKFPGPHGDRFQVRLAIEPSADPNARLEIITFTFETQEAADTVVHLLDGYCGESVGAVLQDGVCDISVLNANQRSLRGDFLPNGCPYRLREDNDLEIQSMEISRSSVHLEQVLGDGQFGDVYKGSYKKYPHAESLPVAVKTCKTESTAEDRRQFLEEARILGQFNHPHVIRLLGICSDNPIWLVMEFAPLGELRHYLLSNQNRVPVSMRVTFCYQIVTALTCLEDRKCVHRDIAARNVLVAREDWVKLADFGMARMLKDAAEVRAEKGRKMPIKWMPPESIHERRFSLASDVWMFGVCMWEILSGGVKPFADKTNAQAAELVAKGQRLKRPTTCPPNLYILMLECWSLNPQHRPRFSLLRPRLRELAAQTRTIASPIYLNDDSTVSPESTTSQTGSHSGLPTEQNALTNQSTPSAFQHSNAATEIALPERIPEPPVGHSKWDEFTELVDRTGQDNEKPADSSALRKLASERGGMDSLKSGSRKSRSDQPHMKKNLQLRRPVPSPRSPIRVTFIQSTKSCGALERTSSCSNPHGAPDITREPSPRRKTVPTLHLDEFMRINDTSTSDRSKNEEDTDKRPNTPTRTSFDLRYCEGLNSARESRESPNATNIHSSTDPLVHSNFVNNYEAESADDPIYTATIKVVQTVRLVSQELANTPPESYVDLAKRIGVTVKHLFEAVEAEFGLGSDENEVFLAERQLNASMYHLISTIKDAKLPTNRGPLMEEFRRHLMTLSYVVANDAHSLYSAVHAYRLRNTSTNKLTE